GDLQRDFTTVAVRTLMPSAPWAQDLRLPPRCPGPAALVFPRRGPWHAGVVTSDQVADELLRRAHWSSSRSSGPGGQRRDKVETRAELMLESADLVGLDEEVAARLCAALRLDEGPPRITA